MSTPAYKERLDALYVQYPKFKTCTVCGETKSHAHNFRAIITAEEAERRGYRNHHKNPMKDSTDVCAACNPLIITPAKLRTMTNAEVAEARKNQRITKLEYANEMEARKSALLRPKKRVEVRKDWHERRHSQRWEWLRGEIRKDQKLAQTALLRHNSGVMELTMQEFSFMVLLEEAAIIVLYKLKGFKKEGRSSVEQNDTLRKVMGEKLTTALLERWQRYELGAEERRAQRTSGGRKPVMPRLIERLTWPLLLGAPDYFEGSQPKERDNGQA